jgi:hypothetical protein
VNLAIAGLSVVLAYENSYNSYSVKQEAMSRYLQLAASRQEVDAAIRQKVERLEQNGLKAINDFFFTFG